MKSTVPPVTPRDALAVPVDFVRDIVGVVIVKDWAVPGCVSDTLPATVPWLVMETVGVPVKTTSIV
jgi:hypothetical protein